jgi:hypothetical protein
MFGRKQKMERAVKEAVLEMDREYGAVQLMALYQLPRFSDVGPLTPGDEREAALKRICTRISLWGVSPDDPQQRASDHSFWMYACDKHAEDVVRWDEELSQLETEEERRAATTRFRSRYQGEFLRFAVEHPEL